MEEKYTQFLNYDWENNEEWKNYFNNIFPIPQGNKIDHYKRKFYKLKIDADFDVHFYPNQPNQPNQANQSSNRNHINQPSSYSPLIIVESVACFLFLLTFYLPSISLKISIALLTGRLFSINGAPKWNVQYLDAILFNSEDFMLVVYSFILMLEDTTLLLFAPLLEFVLFKLLFNLKKMNLELVRPYKRYINYVLSAKPHVDFYLNLFQFAMGVILLGGIVTGMNSFIYAVIYWLYLRFAHSVSPSIQNTVVIANNELNRIKQSNFVPNGVKIVIEKIQSAFSHLGSINTHSTILICRIF